MVRGSRYQLTVVMICVLTALVYPIAEVGLGLSVDLHVRVLLFSNSG